MYKSANPELWQGRVDDEPGAKRWFQAIQPITPTSRPGVALLGFAVDSGVKQNKGRVGAAQAPDVVRSQLGKFAFHCEQAVYDAGTLVTEDESVVDIQHQLADQVKKQVLQGHLTLCIGGGHEIAYGSFKGLADAMREQESTPKIGIINFDAHLDLRDDNEGASSGTPFWQIAKYCQQAQMPFNYLCLGVSEIANTRALFNKADGLGVNYRLDHQMNHWDLSDIQQDITQFLNDIDHLYITIDMDVFNASYAPGVSAPAPFGLTPDLVEHLVRFTLTSAANNNTQLRLADIAEVNPTYDRDGQTARLAARFIDLFSRYNLNSGE